MKQTFTETTRSHGQVDFHALKQDDFFSSILTEIQNPKGKLLMTIRITTMTCVPGAEFSAICPT